MSGRIVFYYLKDLLPQPAIANVAAANRTAHVRRLDNAAVMLAILH